MQKVFDRIDAAFPQYVKIWEDICNIESPTAEKARVDEVGNYFVRFAEARGWAVERFEQPLVGDVVCITMNEGAAGKPITLSGHMDTVHPVGLFGSPAVKIEGDRIYGPGVMDCKGGLVVALLAMAALEDAGFSERPLRLLLQSDEEGGSAVSNKATIGYICEKSADSAAFLNMEGHSAGKICVQRKGIVTFTFKIHGIEAHSSVCAKRGANAIAEAAHKILKMEELKDSEGLTCNCGVIKGGSVPNTVAGYCEFKANIRFVTDEQLAWVTEYAKQVAETVHIPGCTCELEQSSFRVAMERRDINLALLDRINVAMEKAGFSTFEPELSAGGSDAADVTAYGKVPCVDKLGVTGRSIHSPNEFAHLESLREMAKRVAAIVWFFEE